MKISHIAFALTLAVSGSGWAADAQAPFESHIHLSRQDIWELEHGTKLGHHDAQLHPGEPAPAFTTMAVAAEAGVHPFAPPEKTSNKVAASPFTKLPRWAYGLIALLTLCVSGAAYAYRVRRNPG